MKGSSDGKEEKSRQAEEENHPQEARISGTAANTKTPKGVFVFVEICYPVILFQISKRVGDKMRILVIDSGARGAGIYEKLTAEGHKVHIAPGNGGIPEENCVAIDPGDVGKLLEFARTNRIDLTVPGQELPLANGIVDRFRGHNLPVVGPNQKDARLETSKIFTKSLARRIGVPTADFTIGYTYKQARKAARMRLKAAVNGKVVIKADGLCGGKGAVIVESHAQIDAVLKDFMQSAASQVVVEDCLEGREVSLMYVVRGSEIIARCPAVQDYKRRFDRDKGPNTGSMGGYHSPDLLSAEEVERAEREIVLPTLREVSAYSGILYAGLMLTREGPKLLEYNIRFGDPEGQIVLLKLKSSLAEIFLASLDPARELPKVEWDDDCVVDVVLAHEGYPFSSSKDKQIFGDTEVFAKYGTIVRDAGTKLAGGVKYTNGGRVTNVLGKAPRLLTALAIAYAGASHIQFEGKAFRKDIAWI